MKNRTTISLKKVWDGLVKILTSLWFLAIGALFILIFVPQTRERSGIIIGLLVLASIVVGTLWERKRGENYD